MVTSLSALLAMVVFALLGATFFGARRSILIDAHRVRLSFDTLEDRTVPTEFFKYIPVAMAPTLTVAPGATRTAALRGEIEAEGMFAKETTFVAIQGTLASSPTYSFLGSYNGAVYTARATPVDGKLNFDFEAIGFKQGSFTLFVDKVVGTTPLQLGRYATEVLNAKTRQHEMFWPQVDILNKPNYATVITVDQPKMEVTQDTTYVAQTIAPDSPQVQIAAYRITNLSDWYWYTLKSFTITTTTTATINNFSSLKVEVVSDRGSTWLTPIQFSGTGNTSIDLLAANNLLASETSVFVNIYVSTGSTNVGSVSTSLVVLATGALDLITTTVSATGQTMILKI